MPWCCCRLATVCPLLAQSYRNEFPRRYPAPPATWAPAPQIRHSCGAGLDLTCVPSFGADWVCFADCGREDLVVAIHLVSDLFFPMVRHPATLCSLRINPKRTRGGRSGPSWGLAAPVFSGERWLPFACRAEAIASGHFGRTLQPTRGRWCHPARFKAICSGLGLEND